MVYFSLWAHEWLYVRRNLLFLQKSFSPGRSINVPKRRFHADEVLQLRKRWILELPLEAYEG
jgi:hypothetical protein